MEKKTSDTNWLQVLEVVPKSSFEEGIVDEMKQSCKFIKILSNDDDIETDSYWAIPVGGLRRYRTSVWVHKGILLAKVNDTEFVPVKSYLDRSREEYTGYIPQLEDISPKKYFNGMGGK